MNVFRTMYGQHFITKINHIATWHLPLFSKYKNTYI